MPLQRIWKLCTKAEHFPLPLLPCPAPFRLRGYEIKWKEKRSSWRRIFTLLHLFNNDRSLGLVPVLLVLVLVLLVLLLLLFLAVSLDNFLPYYTVECWL